MHAFTDPINRSVLFEEWHTLMPEGSAFGGKIFGSDDEFLGKNGFIFADNDSEANIRDLLHRLVR